MSPPLAWGEPAKGARSFALIVEDPDAAGGIYTHWLIYNIPPTHRQLNEGVPTNARLTSGAVQGRNTSGRLGYSGPCPPPGPAHRYLFRLYALDRMVDLPAGASKEQVLENIEGHMVSQAELIGRYQR